MNSYEFYEDLAEIILDLGSAVCRAAFNSALVGEPGENRVRGLRGSGVPFWLQ